MFSLLPFLVLPYSPGNIRRRFSHDHPEHDGRRRAQTIPKTIDEHDDTSGETACKIKSVTYQVKIYCV